MMALLEKEKRALAEVIENFIQRDGEGRKGVKVAIGKTAVREVMIGIADRGVEKVIVEATVDLIVMTATALIPIVEVEVGAGAEGGTTIEVEAEAERGIDATVAEIETGMTTDAGATPHLTTACRP